MIVGNGDPPAGSEPRGRAVPFIAMTPQVPAIVAALRAKYPGHVVILRALPVSLVYAVALDMPIVADAKWVEGLIESRTRNGWPLLVVEVVEG